MNSFMSRNFVGALLITVATGCATMGRGSAETDAEQVATVIKLYGETLVSQDIDRMMDLVSENFESASKADVHGFWINFKASGALEDIELNFDDAETKIDGDSASVGPLFLSSTAGSLTQDFYLTKEVDGVWRVTDVQQY